MQPAPNNDHDRVVRLCDWRKAHEEKEHPSIALEIRELRGTMNKLLMAIMGLMITIVASVVGYTLNNLGG